MTTFFFIAAVIGGYFGVRLWLKPRIDERPELKLMLGAGASIVAAWAIAKWAGYSAAGWTFGLMFGPVAVVLAWQKAFGDGGGWGASGDHVRGNRLATVREVRRMTARVDSQFEIGSVRIPRELETRSFLFCGGMGTGKTQAFHGIMQRIRADGKQRAIVADVGGGYISKYWREGDICLSPFDQRGVDWSPFAEIRCSYDCDRIAKSLVPDLEGEGRPWSDSAQTIVSALLEKLWESGTGTNGELVRLVNQDIMSLKPFLAGTPAEGQFGNEKTVGSVQHILSTYLRPFKHLNPSVGAGGFSVRDWMAKGGDGAWLYLVAPNDQHDSVKPIVSACLDIAATELLSMREDLDRRFWFTVDEFSSFGKMNSLYKLLTQGRRFGGSCILGMQELAQLYDAYGQNTTKTILANIGTWLVLGTRDPDTSEYMSRYLGDEEIRREQVSEGSNFDPMSMRRSTNTSTSVEYRQQRIVLASEIQKLPDRVGFLNIAGPIPPCPVEIPIANLPIIAECFVPRPRGARNAPVAAAVSAAAEAYAMPTPDEIEVQPEPEFDAAEAYDEPPSGIDEGPIPDGLEPGPEIPTGTQRDAGYSHI